jgi:hypothetical protein
VSIFKKGNKAPVVNYRPICMLNIFYRTFESIMYKDLSFYFKFKLHPNQHDCVKSKSTVPNLVT